MRRIVSSVILLGLLVGLVALIVGAVKWVTGVLSAENEKNISRTVVQKVEVNGCLPADLSLSVVPSHTDISQGNSMDVSVELLNVGEKECSFSLSDLSLKLVSGDRDVWTPTACAADQRLLLLAPEQPWGTSFTWNGGVWADCTLQVIEIQPSISEEGAQSEAPKPETIPATASAGPYQLVGSITGGAEPVVEVITVH